MKNLNLLSRIYGVNCPKCRHELFVYSTFSQNKFALKCDFCGEGYMYYKDEKKLLISSVVEGIEKQWEKDPYNKYYKGTPTSVAFSPTWIKNLL